jgi:hypothetical protein
VLALAGHFVHQAPIVRLAGIDHAPGQDQLECPAQAHDPRQALCAAVDQRHSPAALGVTELGVAGCDPQVAPQRQLEAARQAIAGDRGDRRLRRGDPGEAHRAFGLGVEPLVDRGGRVFPLPLSRPLAHRLQVGSRTEGLRPLAREYQRPGVVIGLEVAVAVEQQARRLVVDGVAALGPGDRQHSGGADPLVAHLGDSSAPS